MRRGIIGGLITLVIGGSTFAIKQSDVVNNFAKNTGETQQQAQQYVKSSQNNVESFSKVGQGFVSDGNSGLNTLSNIDCSNYTYAWVSNTLSCNDGYDQLQTVSNDEVTLGNCYEALGSNLGNAAKSTMSECISDGDIVVSDYNLPIVTAVLDSSSITTKENAIEYNKSVLQAALNQ